MIRTFLMSVAAVTAVATGALAQAAKQNTPTRDYLGDKFQSERILDWGDRPVWSPDSKRIAFTVDDEHLGPAYEMDLATRKVRCLTCRWGAAGYVVRIYYLADDSFLIVGPPSLDTAEAKIGEKPQRASQTFLYWMPADASLPPQPLGASVFGEVALDYDHSAPGTARIAWGEFGKYNRMLIGDIVNDGKRAFLVNRTVLYSDQQPDPKSLVTFTETYDFIDGGKSVTFFTKEKGRPFNGMYKADIATGKMTAMPTDAQHNETHSFPDVRFGLEESNRASDPSGEFRGMSGHRAAVLARLLEADGEKDAEALGARFGGKPFELYVIDWNTGKRRRLTYANDHGGEAHQSSPARDGRHIAYSIRDMDGGSYTGAKGLYVGTFSHGAEERDQPTK